MKSIQFNISLLISSLVAIGILITAGFHIASIDTDITRYHPQKNSTIADAGSIFKHHPAQGEWVIDQNTIREEQFFTWDLLGRRNVIPAKQIKLTPIGAYHAALDTERASRRDVELIIGSSILCMALLLAFSFPRSRLVFFSFLPALAGTAAAFFILSLFQKTVSIITVGFGGAIISITMDHGIAYLLFLDQSRTACGKEASTEIWTIGLIAALTTIGAFCALMITGSPILAQIGQFAAWGIAVSFLFVHFVFPKIFPELPPARPSPSVVFRAILKLPMAGKPVALSALAFAAIMFYFADFHFNADLSRINAVGEQTGSSEAMMNGVWGNGLNNKLDVMTEANRASDLQAKGDQILFANFFKILVVVGISVALLIFLFFVDLRLTAITMAPTAFAMAGTLGTLGLLGHPLDISALMIPVIVFGLGIDYSLMRVHAYQRYGGTQSLDFGRMKMAVIMAACSSLIGFGMLCLGEHPMLHNVGLTSLLGIGYSLVGAFLLLPPLLAHHFRPMRPRADRPALDRRQRLLSRYKYLDTYPRLFARFKLKTDVMFSELSGYLDKLQGVQTVLDIGCGYGVPGCWVLEHCPIAKIYGIDPDRERIRVATRVFADRGEVQCDSAPNIPKAPGPADLAVLLDMDHYLDEKAWLLTLQRLLKALNPTATLIIRALIPQPNKQYSKVWKVEVLKMKYSRITTHHRPIAVLKATLDKAGFEVKQTTLSGNNPESAWLIAAPKPEALNTAEPIGP